MQTHANCHIAKAANGGLVFDTGIKAGPCSTESLIVGTIRRGSIDRHENGPTTSAYAQNGGAFCRDKFWHIIRLKGKSNYPALPLIKH